MARPRKEIDWDEVDLMMLAGCKASQIIGDLHIDDSTFYDRFRKEYGVSYQDYSVKMHNKGKGNILKTQYKKAVIDENVQMLTLLGVEYLDQGKKQVDASPPNDQLIELENKIMQLQSELNKFQDVSNKSQAEFELSGIEPPV